MQSLNLLKNSEIKFKDTSWDFRESYTKYSNHGFHTYPAMMIPQITRRLIDAYGKKAEVILDPFMGSGTALLEATLSPNFKKAYGIDINPLALLIAKVKTTALDSKTLLMEYRKLMSDSLSDKKEVGFNQKKIELPKFFNINFWFKPEVIIDLTIIKNNINKIENKDIRDFFLVVFSEVVRTVSNTRKREYKLYRIAPNILKNHNPKTIEEFRNKAQENIQRMLQYVKEKLNCEVRILNEDTRCRTSIPDNSVDLILTSPPYGDSRTTVAYGQFSRLALQWLGYDEKTVLNIDKTSLGGVPAEKIENNLYSATLQETVKKIAEESYERAKDVLSFYLDFDKCVTELHRVTKSGAYLCFVVGNRTVKGVQIPTDEIILELFQSKNSYKHHNTFIRNIPHKRMPKLNSPSNIRGNHAVTMNEEWIVILEKA